MIHTQRIASVTVWSLQTFRRWASTYKFTARSPAERRPIRPRQILAYALAAVVGLISMGGCRQELHHDLTERAANELIVALAQAEIPSEKVASDDGWVVTVPSSEYHRALTVLASRNLPRVETDVFELLENARGLVPSPEQEHLRKVTIITAGLEQTFLAMDSVVDARVHAVLPGEASLLSNQTRPDPPSASVVIVYRAGMLPPSDESVRAILRGAIGGLESTHISTVLVETQMPEATKATMVGLGPFSVSQTSAGWLRWTLVVLLAVIVALLTVVGWLRFRRPADSRASTEAKKQP